MYKLVLNLWKGLDEWVDIWLMNSAQICHQIFVILDVYCHNEGGFSGGRYLSDPWNSDHEKQL